MAITNSEWTIEKINKFASNPGISKEAVIKLGNSEDCVSEWPIEKINRFASNPGISKEAVIKLGNSEDN